VLLLVRLSVGAGFPGWAMLVGPLLGAVLWPPLTWLLLMPQRRLEREHML
jgi:rod shape-determining protein MreD